MRHLSSIRARNGHSGSNAPSGAPCQVWRNLEPLEARLLLSAGFPSASLGPLAASTPAVHLPAAFWSPVAGKASGTVTDDFGNTFGAACNLTLDASGAGQISGRINYTGDMDMFAVKATVSGKMQVNLNAPSGGKAVDPVLTLYDGASTQLAYSNNAPGSKNAVATVDAVAGQTYYVKAASYNSNTGAYTLLISTTQNNPVPPPPPPPPPAPAPTPPAYLPGPNDYAPGAAITGQVVSTGSGLVLVIVGTDQNDNVRLSQSGDHVTLITPSGSQDFAGPFAGAVVYGFGGDDLLRADNTMTVVTVIYAGGGNDSLFEARPDTAYLYGQDGSDLLVTVGGGADVLYGGAGLDSFWFDSSDNLADAEATETAAKTIHKIAAFVQPTTDPSQSVSLEITGQDIVDPVANYAYTNNFINRPLWVNGPQYNDIRQGQVGDCYFLAGLSALADTDAGLLQQSIAPLGDGTYAVRFYASGGAETYYRIDAQLPTSGSSPGYANLTPTGELWVALLEKAFAQYRYGQNSYASLESGYMYEAYIAITGTSFSTSMTGSTSAATLAQNMANSLAAGHAVSAASNNPSSFPIISGHAYNVHSVSLVGGAWYVTVYNPWGFDGASYDSNPGDGLLTLTASQFQSLFGYVQVCNA